LKSSKLKVEEAGKGKDYTEVAEDKEGTEKSEKGEIRNSKSETRKAKEETRRGGGAVIPPLRAAKGAALRSG